MQQRLNSQFMFERSKRIFTHCTFYVKVSMRKADAVYRWKKATSIFTQCTRECLASKPEACIYNLVKEAETSIDPNR